MVVSEVTVGAENSDFYNRIAKFEERRLMSQQTKSEQHTEHPKTLDVHTARSSWTGMFKTKLTRQEELTRAGQTHDTTSSNPNRYNGGWLTQGHYPI